MRRERIGSLRDSHPRAGVARKVLPVSHDERATIEADLASTTRRGTAGNKSNHSPPPDACQVCLAYTSVRYNVLHIRRYDSMQYTTRDRLRENVASCHHGTRANRCRRQHQERRARRAHDLRYARSLTLIAAGGRAVRPLRPTGAAPVTEPGYLRRPICVAARPAAEPALRYERRPSILSILWRY